MFTQSSPCKKLLCCQKFIIFLVKTWKLYSGLCSCLQKEPQACERDLLSFLSVGAPGPQCVRTYVHAPPSAHFLSGGSLLSLDQSDSERALRARDAPTHPRLAALHFLQQAYWGCLYKVYGLEGNTESPTFATPTVNTTGVWAPVGTVPC